MPQGGIDPGEDPWPAALRELHEETNIRSVKKLDEVADWLAYDLPDLGRLTTATRRPSITLVTTDGQILASYGDLYGKPVNLDELPPYLPDALLATEDRRFYSHFGLDPRGLLRATLANFEAGHLVQGGSTITQQLAKNVFLTPDRTVRRKGQEVLLAFWLEHTLTKQQILALYLNRVYFGAGTYGVDAAARKYFGKPAAKVTPFEAAMLAGMVKAPSRYNPLIDPKRATDRAKQVLASMVDAGYMTDADRERLHGPAGLDLGSEEPEEIAQSIVGEIIAVKRDRAGGFLKERAGPIHDRPKPAGAR